jgi:C4-dicarboxylate transporter DctM subunit
MLLIFAIYIVGGMAKDVPLEDMFKGVSFFLPAYIPCVIILMLFPQIITFLPALVR